MRHRPGARLRDDRGSLSLELVIAFPVMLLLVTAVLQAGIWFHAHSLALAAAQQGVGVARSLDATSDAGVEAARGFLDDQAGGTLEATRVTASEPGAEQVRIDITGRALSILPGVRGPTVDAHAVGPVERFTTQESP